MKIPTSTDRFTPMQLRLLNMFATDISEEHLVEIQALLSKYFADKLSEEMDRHIESQGKTVDEWVNEMKDLHLRTPYKH